MSGDEDAENERAEKISVMQNDKRTRRGAGARSCVRVFNYTQGDDPGCFFVPEGA